MASADKSPYFNADIAGSFPTAADLSNTYLIAVQLGGSPRMVKIPFPGNVGEGAISTPLKALMQSVLGVDVTNATLFDSPYTQVGGGLASSIESLATAGLQVSIVRLLVNAQGAQMWTLAAGTDANAQDGSGAYYTIRPLDYNAATNAKVWKRVL